MRACTIYNMTFPQFPQAYTQGPARHRDSSLDSNTPHGAAPAFIDKQGLKQEVQNMQSRDSKPILQNKSSEACWIYWNYTESVKHQRITLVWCDLSPTDKSILNMLCRSSLQTLMTLPILQAVSGFSSFHCSTKIHLHRLENCLTSARNNLLLFFCQRCISVALEGSCNQDLHAGKENNLHDEWLLKCLSHIETN